MHVYIVRLERGTENVNFRKFYSNIIELNAKPVDYGGMKSECLISHHADISSIQVLIENDFEDRSQGVTIEEITKVTLKGKHKVYKDSIINYFIPYNKYENIGRIRKSA